MRLIDVKVKCNGRADRFELFVFGDCHISKRNCSETAINKQVGEILRRSKMPNRHVRVVLGGDIINAINPSDIRRFDFSELADWLVESDAENTRERLGDIANQEIIRAVNIFKPIRHLIVGAIEGNHEKMMQKRQNINVHKMICDELDIVNGTDEMFMRFTFSRGHSSTSMNIYVRHGYGSGRSAGAEPNKLYNMLSEWEDAAVCLTGHTHTFDIAPPKPVLFVPKSGELPKVMPIRHRFAANWGCWLLSHLCGEGSYESGACYPAKPMMTVKVVIWPFWEVRGVHSPKVEMRQYAIL